ncbi:MAG: hypothetical protein CHACPFDD_03489 [Phycisphaerae bacterium]|nr:hypothetical protein [Phycisphaerae bacterium]
MRSILLSLGLSASLAFLAGCSATGAAMTGAQVGLNLSKQTTYLRIKLDGKQAKENMAEKAMSGYSRWKIDEPVSTSPMLEFAIKDPDKLGRITSVIVSIYQAFEADYSHQADFTIVATDANNPLAQMKPDTPYDLSYPGPGFKVLDVTGKEIPKVEMKPGVKYKAILSIRADKSESAIIFFKTT